MFLCQPLFVCQPVPQAASPTLVLPAYPSVSLFLCHPITFFSLFLCQLLPLTACPSVNLFLCQLVPLSACSPVTLFHCQLVPQSTCSPVALFHCQLVPLSACSSVSLFLCQPVHLSACSSVSVFLGQLVPLSACSSVSLFLCQLVPLSAQSSVSLPLFRPITNHHPFTDIVTSPHPQRAASVMRVKSARPAGSKNCTPLPIPRYLTIPSTRPMTQETQLPIPTSQPSCG
jgi:hypothetical protein